MHGELMRHFIIAKSDYWILGYVSQGFTWISTTITKAGDGNSCKMIDFFDAVIAVGDS